MPRRKKRRHTSRPEDTDTKEMAKKFCKNGLGMSSEIFSDFISGRGRDTDDSNCSTNRQLVKDEMALSDVHTLKSGSYSDFKEPKMINSGTNDACDDNLCSSLPAISPIGNLLSSSSTIPPTDRKQLLFFYKCETTGGSHYEEHVIEIGAAVIVPDHLTSTITTTEYSTLCHTSRRIDPNAFAVHGISKRMLKGKPPFSTAFRELFDWIKQCVQEASCKKDLYYPVLIAHNGFGFHYLFLMAEIKRHNSEPIFSTSDVWFADTLHDTRRLVRAGDPTLPHWCQARGLGLESLFNQCFPGEHYQGHRVTKDLHNLKRVFTTVLSPVLANLTLRSKGEVWNKWYKKWRERLISRPYIAKMGNYCTAKMAVCLHDRDITYDALCAAFVVSSSAEEFDEWMQSAGIRLKIWRNKIENYFS